MSTKLNRDNVRKLIDELKSGKYMQGTHRLLNYFGKFCCLGVAHECLIAPLQTQMGDVARYSEVTQPEYLAVQEKLGISPTTLRHLAYLNDIGASFVEIAGFLQGLIFAEEEAERLATDNEAVPYIPTSGSGNNP
jgi:hypothetical protein